jgi:hypothetical protein
MRKLGFDFHGVLDNDPEFFSELTKCLVNGGNEVHVITGEKDTPEFRKNLAEMGISYTHLFSIASHHLKIGTKVWYKDADNPFMDEETWNKTKADYCEREKIDMHLDDSEHYGKHFKTPFALYQKSPQKNKMDCPDCIWSNEPEGCNVKRGSPVCVLNKRPRRIKKCLNT